MSKFKKSIFLIAGILSSSLISCAHKPESTEPERAVASHEKSGVRVGSSHEKTLQEGAERTHGRVALVGNADESILVITGNTARELYNQMTIEPFNAYKGGEHIKCSIFGEDQFKCVIRLADDGPGNLNGRCGI